MINQIKKSLVLSGHKTSVALEIEFWEALESIAKKNNLNIDSLIQKIDQNERKGSLASALRVFILKSLIEMKIMNHCNVKFYNKYKAINPYTS